MTTTADLRLIDPALRPVAEKVLTGERLDRAEREERMAETLRVARLFFVLLVLVTTGLFAFSAVLTVQSDAFLCRLSSIRRFARRTISNNSAR